MNFDKYKTKLKYPRREEFTVTYWYKSGKCVAEKRGLSAQIFHASDKRSETLKDTVKSQETDDAAYKAAVAAYGADEGRLIELFKANLLEELGVTGHPKADLLYRKAWERGHSAGLSEVYGVAADLVDLIT